MARVRAAGLLFSSVLMVALATLVALQQIHWAWAFAGTALLAVTLGSLRLSVARRRSGRRATARTGPRTSGVRARPAGTARRPSAPGAAQDAAAPARAQAHSHSVLAAQAAAVTVPRTARRAVDLEARRPAPVLYDVDEVETAAAAAPTTPAGSGTAGPAPADQADAGGWDPVPVPPPTYTLKARANRGADELPADGAQMALEEEFEELPQVHHVG